VIACIPDDPIEVRFEMEFIRQKTEPSAFGPGTCLSELDAASLATIIQVAIKRNYDKGEIICLEGEYCQGIYIVGAGWIMGLKTSPQGREQEIRLAGPGEMINEISVVAGKSNLLTLKSLDVSILWLIERDVLFDLMAKHPMLSKIISQNLAKRVVQLLNLVEDLSLRTVEGRLANLLLSRSKDGIIQRHHWSTQAEMAACIGTTPVVVSRVLNEMEVQGVIRLERHRIAILDHKMLESAILSNQK